MLWAARAAHFFAEKLLFSPAKPLEPSPDICGATLTKGSVHPRNPNLLGPLGAGRLRRDNRLCRSRGALTYLDL